MKKLKLWSILTILLTISAMTITSCSSGDTNIADNNSLPSTETVQDKEPVVEGQIEGSFTVTVRELIPDYCYDESTLNCAVVTYFQDEPFIIYVGNDASEILEVGKQYTFTIQPKSIGEIEESLVGKELTYLEAQAFYGRIDFENIKEATEDELGLGGSNITITTVQ